MGEVVELYGDNPLFAECPKCGCKSWFIKLDTEGEYETDLDFLLNIRSIICAECKGEFDIEYGELVIMEKETE